MIFVTALALCLAAANGGPLIGKNGLTGRIVGGEPTTIKAVPYQVSVQVMGRHNCGGSIISKDWILTAAHCMHYPMDILSVRAGSDASENGGVVRTIDRIINHEEYGRTIKDVPINDIALVHLSEPLDFDETRQPIDLYDHMEVATEGSESVVTGWGSTGLLTEEDILRTVSLPIVSKEDCRKYYSSRGGITEGQICAGYKEGGKDSCQGDSGGPLAIQGRLAGVVSWGYGCAQPKLPGVYSEVAHYREWIRENSGL